ncbi:hypothetical protein COBT_000378 [Conglomerata obtusa]
MALTHTEKNISEFLKSYISPELHPHLDLIKLQIVQKEDFTKIMILKVPSQVIDDIKEIYSKFNKEMKKKYTDYFFYMIRCEKSDSLREPEIKKLHEDWVIDLAFPALLQGRRTMITAAGRSEEAMIERKYFFDGNDLDNRAYVFKKLTDRNIIFSMTN